MTEPAALIYFILSAIATNFAELKTKLEDQKVIVKQDFK